MNKSNLAAGNKQKFRWVHFGQKTIKFVKELQEAGNSEHINLVILKRFILLHTKGFFPLQQHTITSLPTHTYLLINISPFFFVSSHDRLILLIEMLLYLIDFTLYQVFQMVGNFIKSYFVF